MWGGNTYPPSWEGNGITQSDVGNLVVQEDAKSSYPETTPTLTLIGRNQVEFPTNYQNLNVQNLNVESINGGGTGVETWSTYKAISDVNATKTDFFDYPQYNINDFKDINCANLYANEFGTSVDTQGGTISGTLGLFTNVLADGSGNFGDLSSGSLVVNGGTTLNGGTLHGTTIGSLPVEGINTIRIDVLPVGIDVVSPTYITIDAGGAANIAAGGAVSIAGGTYIELNSAEVRQIDTTFGDDYTFFKVGNIKPSYGGTDSLRIGDDPRGVVLTSGKDVESLLFRATNLLKCEYYLFALPWNFNTIYSYDTFVSYSTTDTGVFGQGGRYKCVCDGSGANPSVNGGQPPDWVSGSNYTASQLVFYHGSIKVGMFRAKNNITDSIIVPDVDTANWDFVVGDITNPFSAWLLTTDQLYNSIYFDVHSTQDHYYCLFQPQLPDGSLDGLYIAKRVVGTNNLINYGRIYDSVLFPPPFNPDVSGNLNMNGYSILNANDIACASLTPTGTSVLLNGAIDMNEYSINHLNNLYVNELRPNSPSTNINLACSIDMGYNPILNGGAIYLDDIYKNRNTNIQIHSDVDFSSNNVVGVNVLEADQIGANLRDYMTLFSDIDGTGHSITLENLNVNTITGGSSGYITLEDGLDANSQNISNVNSISITNLNGNSGGAIELRNDIAGNGHQILGLTNLTTASLGSSGFSYINLNNSLLGTGTENITGINNISCNTITGNITSSGDLDMNGHNILNTNTCVAQSIATDTITGDIMPVVTFRSPMSMDDNDISNVNSISVDFITSNVNSYVLYHADIEMDGNNLLGVSEIVLDSIGSASTSATLNTNLNVNGNDIVGASRVGTNELLDGGSGIITLGTYIDGNFQQINRCNQIGTDNLTDGGSGLISLGASINGNYYNINSVNSLGLSSHTPAGSFNEANLILYSDADDPTLTLSTEGGTDNGLIYNTNGNITISQKALPFPDSDGISLQSQDNIILTATNDIRLTGGDGIYLNSNTDFAQNNATNINELSINTSFFSVPDTTSYYQYRLEPYSFYYQPYYFSYASNLAPSTFVPIASEWADFPCGRSFMDMNNAYINNLRYTNQQGVRQPMIQRGTGNTGTTYYQITFAQPYTSSSYQVSLTYTQSPSGNTPIYVLAGSKTASGFRVYGVSNQDFDWVSYGDAV